MQGIRASFRRAGVSHDRSFIMGQPAPSFAVVVLAYYGTGVHWPLLPGRQRQVLRLEPVRLQPRLRRLAHPVRRHAQGLHLPPGRLATLSRSTGSSRATRVRASPTASYIIVLLYSAAWACAQAAERLALPVGPILGCMHVAAVLLALTFLFRCQAGATTGSGSSSGAPWALRPDDASELGLIHAPACLRVLKPGEKGASLA